MEQLPENGMVYHKLPYRISAVTNRMDRENWLTIRLSGPGGHRPHRG